MQSIVSSDNINNGFIDNNNKIINLILFYKINETNIIILTIINLI